jgi:hypothetical protein
LNILAGGNFRRQEKTEARLGFDVELTFASGLGRNQIKDAANTCR